MEIKVLEVRDKATFIPVMAIKMLPDDEGARYLLKRAGYGTQPVCVLLIQLEHNRCAYDCYDWGSGTMLQAHHHIGEHFDSLKNGDVIDVEYITGVTKQPKTSERYENHA